MSEITGQEVLDALMRDSEYLIYPKQVLDVMKPFMLAIPEVLKDILGKKVTLDTLLEAKVVFLRYLCENGYVSAVVKSMPEELLGILGRDDVLELMEGMVSELVEMLAEMAKDVPAFLEGQGVTEEQVMADPSMALKPNVLELYKAGKLTVADLLRLQPMVIVKNTK